MQRTKLKSLLNRALLLFSLVFFVFLYGVAVGQYKFFPHRFLFAAKNALDALIVVYTDDAVEGEYQDLVEVPTVRDHAAIEGNELLLVSGGNAVGYLKTENPNGCLAWLMDRHGDVKHVWTYDPNMWGEFRQVRTTSRTFMAPTGLHLYEDGSLLVNFTGRDCYPPAVGVALLDRDSKVLWKKELLTHHWFDVDDDGQIFVPAINIIDAPVSIGKTSGTLHSTTPTFKADVVLTLDQDGNVLNEISMLDALFDSGYHGLFQDFAKRSTDVTGEDPLHLNDVKLVPADVAQAYPWLNEGDLLVSLRNVNAVGILDPGTRLFKWMVSGVTVRQHSPRFYKEGLLIFDNRGGDRSLGGTQLVHVPFERPVPTTLFPKSAAGMPDKCYTEMAGHLDLHRDGKRVLMTVCEQGVIWEVDLETSEVLWEYIYVHPNESGKREELETAIYVYDADFPMNREDESRE